MKTVLIVFVVLLFLLTLLTSFGGSIRRTASEPFYDSNPAVTENEYPFSTQEQFFEETPSLPTSNVESGPAVSPATQVEKFENMSGTPEPFTSEDNLAPF